MNQSELIWQMKFEIHNLKAELDSYKNGSAMNRLRSSYNGVVIKLKARIRELEHEVARHFNVQLICLSDINKSDVTSCFECVIKLVVKQQALSNFEIMTHEGNERIEHGYYKIMNGQISLF